MERKPAEAFQDMRPRGLERKTQNSGLRKEKDLYKVSIDRFEGPFDLLVYLLENARMDIYDIKVSEITEQYISYL